MTAVVGFFPLSARLGIPPRSSATTNVWQKMFLAGAYNGSYEKAAEVQVPRQRRSRYSVPDLDRSSDWFFLPTLASRDTVLVMDNHLSPQTEQFLANAVANGMFPSKEAAIDAAVEALREKTESIPMVPEEHMERVERALESLNAGKGKPMTDAGWDALKQRAIDVAAGSGACSA